jgi:3'-phosphoadenosine 5'-phosphosulfate sulfotransferase (PAPS reductase)/FAD synthetase
MKREEELVYVSAVSGGKDSITMTDLLLKHGYPVDDIVFTDTLQEFPDMYRYIDKAKSYFKERYNKDITILMPMATFEEWCFGVIKKPSADGYGAIRGIPNPADSDSQCYHRRETKVKVSEAYLEKKYQNKKIVQYIGYTKGEGRSIKNTKDRIFKYPLKTIFNMTEDDCKKYLIDQEMENPLYKFFSRTGCAMCPFQSERSMFQLYHNFKDTWEYMKHIESRLAHYENIGMRVMNKYWFTGYRSLSELEYKFELNKESLFDFSDEPLKDCFCKM